MPADAHELSEYEILRQRTIERNRRKLEALGLLGGDTTDDVGSKGAGRGRASSESCRRTPAQGRHTATGMIATTEPIRRSLRNQGKASPVYKDHAVGFDDRRGTVGFKRSRPSANDAATVSDTAEIPAVAGPPRHYTSCKPLAPDSSRNLECDLPLLMEHHLGRRFSGFGKDVVMGASTKSVPPKFSRMSGVTEWKNAVFLWVNVCEEGGGYTNLFERTAAEHATDHHPLPSSAQYIAFPPGAQPDLVKNENANKGVWRRKGDDSIDKAVSGGIMKHSSEDDGVELSGSSSNNRVAQQNGFRMTWFAGSRMTAQTAAIQRLLRVGSLRSSRAACNIASDTGSGAASESVTATDDADMNTSVNPCWRKSTSKEATEREPAMTGDVARTTTLAAMTFTHTEASDAAASAGDRSSSASAGDNRSENAVDDAVLLFCRLPKEPYVFCGRLGYADHWPGERPVRFLWQLLDVERLAGFEDFKAVVRAAGVEVE